MLKFLKLIFNFHIWKMRLLNIVLIAFLCSFVGARLYSLYIVSSIYFHGYHIHHFYFGMLFLSVGGVIGILSVHRKFLQIAGALIGIGIGLFADEIGLLLNCTTAYRECLYAFPGISDIVILITALIVLLIIVTGLIEHRYQTQQAKNNLPDLDKEIIDELDKYREIEEHK